MLTIGVLCSGGLGLSTLAKIVGSHKVKFVLTDSKSIKIIEFATQKKIPCYAGNPRKGKGYFFIKNFNVDIIASINYLFLIEKDIIGHSNILTFNIHGSLLPKYRGRTPHVWAIINNEKKAGITAHVIDKGCDTGQIIHQIEVPIEYHDTGATMLEKYVQEYFPLVEKVLQKVEGNDFDFLPQDENKATYFGKRTPNDGQINWNWSKEAIRNWVRAQAHPYPGAFTFYDNKKVIIDKVSFIEFDEEEEYAIGEILSVSPKTIIKVSNGYLKLDKVRTENCNFNKGKIFKNENRQ